MIITMLGTGGFDNEGLPFNSFLMDDSILVETPPDIIVSLGREKKPLAAIDTIYVSHSHGDHLFGMPFLLFNMWKGRSGGAGPNIVGPAELEARVRDLAILAIGPDHPYIDWIAASCRFQAIDEGTHARIGEYDAEFYRMAHSKETYGFGLRRNGELLFQYLPDTLWTDRVAALFDMRSRVVLCDVNGTGGVKSVHMGAEDVARNAIGASEAGTRVIGTHLSRAITEPVGFVEIAKPGMLIRV